MNGRWTTRKLRISRARYSVTMLMALAVFCSPTRANAQRVSAQRTAQDDQSASDLLSRKVTITLNNVPLKTALDRVARTFQVVVQYQSSVVTGYATPVSIVARDMPLGELLEHLLGGTNLRVAVDRQGGIEIVPSPATSADSTPRVGSVTGRVADSAGGRGLSGVTVKVAGTKLSAVTSDSGRFTLRNIPVGDHVLTVRGFGYRPAERAVSVLDGAPVTVRVLVSATPNVLSGVVTTATGVQERRTIGNDVTVINADSVMRTAPIQSVTDLLENRVPGLTIQHTSGMPGAPSRLRLRGIGGNLASGNNTSNDPIIIVDGIRRYSHESTGRDRSLTGSNGNFGSQTYATSSPIDQIDPNSIETIEVFKGPSATSQWGSDAGNGVIVITTKKGRAGTTRVSATTNVRMERMPGQYAGLNYFVFGGGTYGVSGTSALCTDPVGSGGLCATAFRDSVVPFQQVNSSKLSPFATGALHDGTVTVSGGSQALTYAFTGWTSHELGYLKMPSFWQEQYRGAYGAAPPSWMVRPSRESKWSTTGTFGVTPTDGLHLTIGVSLLSSDQRQSSFQTVSNLSAEYVDTAVIKQNIARIGSAAHGGLDLYTMRLRFRSVTSANTVQGDWTRWSWLTVQGTAGAETVNRNDEALVPFGIYNNASRDSVGHFNAGRGNSVTRTGTLNGTLFTGRSITTTTGVQVVQSSTDDFSAYQDTLQQGVSVPASLKGASQNSSANNTAGWFVEPRLNVASRFYFTPGFRLDGGSASTARGSRSGGILSLFPKLNFSWIAVDRQDNPLGGVLSLLRPRLAFGIAGVQPDPTWNLRLLDDTTALAKTPCGLCVNTLGNSQLHPERSQETEGGFEAELWGNRVSVDASVHYTLRRDAIIPITTAPSVYALPFYINLGRIRNTGVELALRAGIIETPQFRWDVHGQLTANRNALVSMNPGVQQYVGYRTFTVGYPIDAVWVRPIAGYTDPDGDGRLLSGDVTLVDSASLVYAGSGQPAYAIPFGTDISLWHSRFSLNAEFSYTNGVTQVQTGGLERLENAYWNPNAPLGLQAAAIAAAACGGDDPFSTISGPCSEVGLVQTTSSLRFSTLSLNYAVPRAIGAKLGLPNVSVALQGSNLRLWTNYRGKDPDVDATTVGEQILDAGQPPLSRIWSIRVNIGN